MAGKPKNQKMIKVIKTIPGYNGIPLPAGCPTFLSVLIKILNQYISTPTKFVVDEKVLSIAILNEAMHTFSVMLNYFSKDGNRQPRFATDELKIITGTMKTSNPKRVTKSELSNYFLKHASIVPDLIPKMSAVDMVVLFREIDDVLVSRQAVSSNPLYSSLAFEESDKASTLKISDFSKTHRFYKDKDKDNDLKEPDETP